MQKLATKLLQYQNHLALLVEPPGREQSTLLQVPYKTDVEEEVDVDVVGVGNLIGALMERVQGQDKPQLQKDLVHIAIHNIHMDSL